jgi:hypothetical protein
MKVWGCRHTMSMIAILNFLNKGVPLWAGNLLLPSNLWLDFLVLSIKVSQKKEQAIELSIHKIIDVVYT